MQLFNQPNKKYPYQLVIFSIGVFLSSIKIDILRFGADVYIYYFLIIPLFLFLFHRHLKISKHILLFFSIITLHSIINIHLGNNTYNLFFKNIIGLLVFTIIYYSIICYSKHDFSSFFSVYMKLSFLVALIGIFQYISWIIKFTPGYDFSWLGFPIAVENGRYLIHSIFSEPAHFATVLSCALFISMRNLINKDVYFINKFKSAVILISFYLTSSSVGYLAIFVCVIIFIFSYQIKKAIILLIILPFIILFAYNNQLRFKERIDSFDPKVLSYIKSEKVDESKYNGSVLILLNGFNVAKTTADNTIIGAGLGSYYLSYNKRSFLVGTSLNQKNMYDGNSMFNRIFAEFGYIGVVLLFIFIIRCRIRKETKNDTIDWVISNSILVMLILVILRQGHYFNYGLPFFILTYYLIKKRHQSISQIKT